MTTQIKRPPQSPPPTYIPEPPPTPKRFFFWWLFRHPLLLLSMLLHGVLLATPMPPAQKVEQPTIKDIPVTKTVSLKRTRVKPKPKPTPKPKPKPQTPPALIQPRPQPVLQPSPKPTKTEKSKPEQTSDAKDQEPKNQASKSPDSDSQQDSENNSEDQDPKVPPAPPIESEEVETIFGELDQALINTEVESEFDYIPSPDDFPEPEKFFTPDSIKAFDIVKNPNLTASGGIINNPRYYRLKDPEAVLASLPTVPAFQSASPPQKIGEYGGGPVYELKIEDKTYFINLVRAKSFGKATFVIFWRWDPNNPPKQEPGSS